MESYKKSMQFKNKNVSNQKGIFVETGEFNTLQEIINEDKPKPPENQFDCFGKSVAAQLKTLPYNKALIAQSRIQNILSNVAIENYKYCNTPGSISLSSSSEFRTQTPVENHYPGFAKCLELATSSYTTHVNK